MRCCSSSDSALDELLDGTLSPVRHARVSAHVAACDDCTALLAELRVIDALLLGPRQLEPAPNFSFTVMADIRSMPAPHVPRSRTFAIIATYIVFAWAAIGAFLTFGGASARAALVFLLGTATRFGAETQSLAAASGRLFGHRVLDVTSAMGALLALDLAGIAFFITGYLVGRARRAQTAGDSW
jgi:anti-sigma factor RsiW